MTDFSVLVGKTLKNVEVEYDCIDFFTSDGEQYRQSHNQECCESVTIDSVVGNWEDIIGVPIIVAEERCSEGNNIDDTSEEDDWYYEGSFTWTFYTIRTIKGSIDIRWLGTSSGYYSESVDFYLV